MSSKAVRQLVFTLEYVVEIDPSMRVDINEIIEKMQESGDARIVGVEVTDK